MSVEKIEGPGRRGRARRVSAMSEHLTRCGVPHLVLERGPHCRTLAQRAVGFTGLPTAPALA
jgi:hypothetical protein